MDYRKWKEVLRKNYHQLIFVFIAFLLMIVVSIISANSITHKKLLSASEEALYTVEANIKTNLREPEATLVSSAFTIQNMIINRNASNEEILQYIVDLTDWLLEDSERVSGFNGIYGVIRDVYLDGMGWVPSEDYVPQRRPWYIAARESGGEIAITTPYIDAQTQTGVLSFAQEVYDADGLSVGVISFDIMLTRLTEYVCSLQQSYGGYGILLDSELNIMAHPIKEHAGIPLPSLSDDYAQVVDDLHAGIEISGQTVRDTDGRRMILFFRKLYNGWYVGMLTPSDNYFGDMYRMEAILIVMGSILMLMLSLILMRLSAAKMRSEEESQLKSSFLARMSHEIRTPMNAILGMVELILRKELPTEAREEALAIKHAGTNLLSIINDILDFSKIESNRMEVVSAPYQLNSLLHDVSNIIQMRVGDKPVVFNAKIDNGLPVTLIGDEARLRQVLLNLLSNAVKYTRRGQVSLDVSGVITDSDLVVLYFRVSDTGIGIKTEDIDRLFGDFTQLDTHKNMGIEGTGLGLAITEKLCRLMGGNITVTSQYGIGSVFTVTLPQKMETFTPVAENNNMEPMDGSTGDEINFSAPSARILIVDDVEINIRVVEGLLSPYAAQLDFATNGREAVSLIKENEYDLVFMDHMMPEMDGVEAVKVIRGIKAPRFQKLPIVSLTANAVSGMREMFLENGFSDYLAKPIDMPKLIQIMDRWIPADKRVKLTEAENPVVSDEPVTLEIAGLDTKRGQALTGGMEHKYCEVLALYCHDAKERIADLIKPLEEGSLPSFVTQIHGLKSASASIGASALSEQAALLEQAGLNSDIALIQTQLGSFCHALWAMTERIEAALESRRTDIPPEEGTGMNMDTLTQLNEALEAEDIENINRLVDTLTQQPLDGNAQHQLETLSEYILLSEFERATELIANLL